MGLISTQAHPSFRTHLTTVVTIGVLALSVTASLFTAWMTSKNLYDVLVDDGLQVTQSLAEQSVLALLYGSSENAEDAVRVTLSFPSVTQVMILSQEGDVLLSEGGPVFSVDSYDWPTTDAVVVDDLEQWVLMAPVYAEGGAIEDDVLLLQQRGEVELLGYVVVCKSKDKLRSIQVDTVVNNLLIGLLFSLILVYILRQRFKHLTDPLYDLSTVMLEAQKEGAEGHPYAKLNGPIEVVQIADSYNKMMQVLAERDQQLRDHNEHLESEVAQRTQELVDARDMAVDANQNKSEFLANVTHELRTPLQAIIGFSDLINETIPETMDDVHQDIESILVNAENLLELINSLLDFSKAESGKMELSLQPENLQTLFDQVIDTVKSLAEVNGNEISLDLDIPSEKIEIDRVKVRQILLNLLSNALKFTEKGEITLFSRFDDNRLTISISDTGIGIAKENQSGIFDAFKQVDGSHTRRYQGTGLGLAISQSFSKLMGGEIILESRLNQGSTFTLIIPLRNSKNKL
ncbi:Two-component system sensor histidine kinase/response regulator hybrid [hydrothermal vent metagenome]|uniref:histidine kinase n=1 Tax=hydrothermal vent metagenome TaxID=652676 RepID=A0A3B0ZEP0_9ZZZZ